MISVEEILQEIDSFMPTFEVECFEQTKSSLMDDMRRKMLAMKLSEIERKKPGLTTQALIDLLK